MWYVLLSLLLLYFFRSLRVQRSNRNLIKEKAKEKNHVFLGQFTCFYNVWLQAQLNPWINLMVWTIFYLWDSCDPFVTWTNEKKPHPWCENTVSHHGVDLAGLRIVFVRVINATSYHAQEWDLMKYQKGIAWVQYYFFPHNFFYFFIFFTFCSFLLFYPFDIYFFFFI